MSPEVERKNRSGREEAFGQRAISPPYHPPSPSSGISGPIKGISIHPFPYPSSPGMHQTGSDNPFYDCGTDFGRQSSTKTYKTFGESMHDIKSGKITQKRNSTSSLTQKFNDHSLSGRTVGRGTWSLKSQWAIPQEKQQCKESLGKKGASFLDIEKCMRGAQSVFGGENSLPSRRRPRRPQRISSSRKGRCNAEKEDND